MRVQVIRRDRDEAGATAVVVAVFAIALFLMAGFVVDVGQAYANKRQLQSASDGGVLAAVQVYPDQVGSCEQLAANAALEADAHTAADDLAEDNRSGQNELEFEVECIKDADNPYDGALEVTYGADRETPSYFGPGGPITADANSRAVMFVPGAAERFRPYGLCSVDVPAASAMPTGVIEVKQPGQAHAGSGCVSAESGGNWWFMACPGTGPGGMNPGELAVALEEGCENPASVVSPQNPSTPSTLSASLTANCNDIGDVSESCLSGETGNSDLKNKTPVAAWLTILGETIIVPVFCAEPTCDPSSVIGGGSRVYPVHKFTAVTVCAYHIYAKAAEVSTDTTACPGAPSKSYVEKLGCHNDNDACIPSYDDAGNLVGMEKPKDSVRLWLRYTRTVAGLGTPANCRIGDPCDAGLRQYALSE